MDLSTRYTDLFGDNKIVSDFKKDASLLFREINAANTKRLLLFNELPFNAVHLTALDHLPLESALLDTKLTIKRVMK